MEANAVKWAVTKPRQELFSCLQEFWKNYNWEMMWISDKMSLDWKPCKEGGNKRKWWKNRIACHPLRHTLKAFPTPRLDPLACYCVALCISVWGASPWKKLKWWESWLVTLNNITCFSVGEGKKGRNTLLSSKKITAEEMSAAAWVLSLESNSHASMGKRSWYPDRAHR